MSTQFGTSPGHDLAETERALRELTAPRANNPLFFQRFIPGVPAETPAILPMETARALVPPGATLIQSPFVDIALLAQFAATADPAAFPPNPSYIRDADAVLRGIED